MESVRTNKMSAEKGGGQREGQSNKRERAHRQAQVVVIDRAVLALSLDGGVVHDFTPLRGGSKNKRESAGGEEEGQGQRERIDKRKKKRLKGVRLDRKR